MTDNILDTPLQIYDGSVYNFYKDFEVTLNQEKFLLNTQMLMPIRKLWAEYPDAPTPEKLCKCSGITKKIKDVSLSDKSIIANMLNIREEEVGDVKTIEILGSTLRGATLLYTIIQGKKKYLIIFSSGETHAGRYQRLLEAAFEI